jgi:hypothetical protein
MAVTQADIDRLNAALANGERQVVLDGQSITYRSVAELITARGDLQRQLDAATAAATSAEPRPKQWGLYQQSRGF